MQQDISCVFQAMGDLGAIYVSGLAAASDLRTLRKLGIQAVLTVARRGLLQHARTDIPLYMYIPAQDHPSFDLSAFFDQTYQFIDDARKQTNVLIHCMAGISRSATIAAAYLVRKYGYPVGKVMELLQRKRSKISPNEGFMRQLQQIEGQSLAKSPEKIKIHCEDNSSEQIKRQIIKQYSSNAGGSKNQHKRRFRQTLSTFSYRSTSQPQKSLKNVDEMQPPTESLLIQHQTDEESMKRQSSITISPSKSTFSPSKLQGKIQKIKQKMMQDILGKKLKEDPNFHSNNFETNFFSIKSCQMRRWVR